MYSAVQLEHPDWDGVSQLFSEYATSLASEGRLDAAEIIMEMDAGALMTEILQHRVYWLSRTRQTAQPADPLSKIQTVQVCPPAY